jgi:hypothetical protein
VDKAEMKRASISTLAEKIRHKTGLDMDIGDLLTKAKAACDAGREPDSAIAPAIRSLFIRSKALAIEIGEVMMRAEPHEVRQAMGKSYNAALVSAYIAYAKDPSENAHDKILEALLHATTGKQQ